MSAAIAVAMIRSATSSPRSIHAVASISARLRWGTTLWRRSRLEAIAYFGADPDTDVPAPVDRRPAAPPDPTSAARAAGDVPLDVVGVAETSGLSERTIRTYITDGRIPPADGQVGKSWWWWASTIEVWMETRNRPGRPRKP